MSWNPEGSQTTGMFAIHGDLDGEQKTEFAEREQFIGLLIDKEQFLLKIAEIREIIMLPPITYVPMAPAFVDGMINLRGTIIPALNMRKMLGYPRTQRTASSRIIITRCEGSSYGIIVDGISSVVALLPSEIERQTITGSGRGGDFITGVSKQGQNVCGIIDADQMIKFAAGDTSLVANDDDQTDTHDAA